MSQETSTAIPLRSDMSEEYQQYRSLSFAAIVTLVFGLLSIPVALVASLSPHLLILPFVGCLIGGYSVLSLRRRTDEFIGLQSAWIGLGISVLSLVFGSVSFAYMYATEVPEGYSRISFSELQPDERTPMIPIPFETISKIQKQKVFVKGYMYPDGQSKDIKRFVLVPDMGTCCFGGKPKLTDMIQVTLADPYRVEYDIFPKKLGGKFFVQPQAVAIKEIDNIVYHLEADLVK